MSSSAEEPDHNMTFTLFFVRHGEALHNVLEKQAKEDALQEAIAEGLDPKDDITKKRMEKARMEILNNDSLQDCPLTNRGVEEATDAKDVIHKLTCNESEAGKLPYPTQVLVSPLQRALQTADTIFPDHASIHVREELQERQTLKACDTRQTSHVLSKRPEFARFSMNRLRLASLTKSQLPYSSYFEDILEDEEDEEPRNGTNPNSRTHASMASFVNPPEAIKEGDEKDEEDVQQEEEIELDYDQVEEKHMLRQRTSKLFGLLRESQHRVVCVVAHKGYLRELERGPLGQPNAKEFKNCEVRVYKVSLLPWTPVRSCAIQVESVERLV